ncbi:MAG: hypothetical protein JWN04_3430 [Myxococcaceae bacterium]|nr:hypothetical protein [Myxococcaceae bacterium]
MAPLEDESPRVQYPLERGELGHELAALLGGGPSGIIAPSISDVR